MFGSMGLLLALQSFGAVYTTLIRELDHGNGQEKILVLLSNGRVAFLPVHSSLAPAFEAAAKNGDLLSVTTDHSRNITSAQTLKVSPEYLEDKMFTSRVTRGQTYAPTVLPSLEKASEIYKGMNRKANSESQCYNRAHVWSWEMYNQHIVKPMKIFVFFTPKYIRRFNFDWWFHVSPYVLTNENGVVTERVMDWRYTKKPLLMKEWTDVFMANNSVCKDVEKYSDYEYHRTDADAPWCMLLRSSMYYYQPLDLERLDKKGLVKDFWVEWELANAYREAFNYRH